MTSNTVPKIQVKQEYATLVPKQSEAEFQALKESIRREGLMQPIVVNQEGIILDGHHRYKACKELQSEIRYTVKNLQGNPAAERIFIVESNCARRTLTKFQKAEMAFKMEASYAEEAERRRLAGLKNVASSLSLVQNCTNDNDKKGRVIDRCAKIAGVSASYYNMARRLLLTAPPELLEELRENKKSINKAYVSLTTLKESISVPPTHQDQQQG